MLLPTVQFTFSHAYDRAHGVSEQVAQLVQFASKGAIQAMQTRTMGIDQAMDDTKDPSTATAGSKGAHSKGQARQWAQWM